MDLKETGRVNPDNFWYYKYKSKFIVKHSLKYQNRINVLFDVGAGSGFFASKFLYFYPGIKAFCIDPFYSRDQLGDKNGLIFVTSPPEIKADTLIFIDVLEHVKDDAKLLEEYMERASDGALFIISVPAFNSLWSNHDIYLEHFRRYSVRDLRDLATKVGLKEVHSTYIFGSLFPVIWIIRQVKKRLNSSKIDSDLKDNSKIINFFILNFLSIEKIFPINKIFGTSALIIARKL